MFTTLIVFQVLTAIGMIAIVLVQRGPGATMGAAFGSGASGTVFGSRGAGNFLTRTTSWLAVAFFGISLTLAVLATGFAGGGAGADSALSGSVVEQEAAAEDEAGAAIDSALESLDRQAAGDENPAPQADSAAAPELDEPADEQPSAAEATGEDGEAAGSEPPAGP